MYENEDNQDKRFSQVYHRAEQICGHDGGFCNPRKAKEYSRAYDQAVKELNPNAQLQRN